MKSFQIRNADIARDLSIEAPTFPKYTSQIINLANQDAQGTRPKIVGQMSDLIQEYKGNTLNGWHTWYLQKMPGAIERATKKIFEMVISLKEAMVLIDESMVRNWVKDLIINKTFSGLRFQESILRNLSIKTGQPYRLATPEDESKGIDGYLGEKPISIKPTTYSSKNMLPESIGVQMVYYEKTKTGIKVLIDE